MLRAIAASLVVVCHAIGYLVSEGKLAEAYNQVTFLLGWLGVGTFFIVSGLIMIRSTAGRFGSTGAAMLFARRRIARIVPMYWLATAIEAVVEIKLRIGPTIGALLCSLLFIPYTTPGVSGLLPLVAQGWTLNYEMFFYLIFSLAMLFPHKVGAWSVVGVLVALVAAGSLIRPLVPFASPSTAPQFYVDPLVLLFAVGVVIGIAENRRTSDVSLPGAVWLSLVLFAVCVAIFLAAGVRFPLPIWWQAAFALACAAAVLACTTRDVSQPGPLGRMLERAGDASYCTYLFHGFLISHGIRFWEQAPASLRAPWMFVVISVIAANLLGYGIHITIERRLNLIARRITSPPSPSAVAGQAT